MMTCNEKDFRGGVLTADNAEDQKSLLATVIKMKRERAAKALSSFSVGKLGQFECGDLGGSTDGDQNS